jgi:glycosyltransferase involved in cell wall biosynthesis
MKKILIFSIAYPFSKDYHTLFTGGAEIAIREVVNRIPDIEFDVVALRFDSDLPRFERLGNINIYRIGFSRKEASLTDSMKFPLNINKFIFPFLACLKAQQLHKKNNYDAIWGMMAAYAGFAAMFFKTFHPRVKYLLTLQEGDPIEHYFKKVGILKPLFYKVFTKADYIQVISTYLGKWARDMGYQGELKVVPNAVDTAHFSQVYLPSELADLKKKLGKGENDKFVITTSRLVLKNAADDVIKSLPYLPVNIKFVILGIGPDEAKLKSLAAELKLEDRVIFLGHIEHQDMPKYLKISDIFIRPSLSEGLGNSFIEAMAAEIPVIATPVGGIPDFLFDPVKNPDQEPTGLFCNVRDPQSIADKIKEFLENKEQTARIVANAKQLASAKYDWDIIARDMREIFINL